MEVGVVITNGMGSACLILIFLLFMLIMIRRGFGRSTASNFFLNIKIIYYICFLDLLFVLLKFSDLIAQMV